MQAAVTKFWKYHGLGNDFIIARIQGYLEPEVLKRWRARALALCDRHRGIGADGILLWSTDSDQSPRMTVINSDGSLAGMCGNGLRCLVSAMHREGDAQVLGHASTDDFFEIRVEAQQYPVRHLAGDDVEVILPAPKQGPIPKSIQLTSKVFEGWWVDLGNPHFVLETPKDASELKASAPALCAHPDFLDGANISFANLAASTEGPALNVDVFERGAGWTQACGTGAVASVLAMVKHERLPKEHFIAVHLPGGTLHICWQQDDRVVMRGPAQYVFFGMLPLDKSQQS